MDCKKARELMSEALDEQLDIEQKEEFFRHLEGCNACKKQWEQLYETVTLLQKQPIEECPIELTQNIKSQIEKEQKKEKKEKLRRISRLAGICAAVVVVAVGATIFATQGWNRELAMVAQTENMVADIQEEGGQMSKTSEAAAASETLAGDAPEGPLATDEPESDNVDTGGAIETIEIVMPDGLMERETLKKIEYHYIQGEGLYIEVTGENQSLVNALMQELKIDLTVTVGQSVIFMEEK